MGNTLDPINFRTSPREEETRHSLIGAHTGYRRAELLGVIGNALPSFPDGVLLNACIAQSTSAIVIDTDVVKEIQQATDRATRYGILGKTLDVSKAADRSFTSASAGPNWSNPRGKAKEPASLPALLSCRTAIVGACMRGHACLSLR